MGIGTLLWQNVESRHDTTYHTMKWMQRCNVSPTCTAMTKLLQKMGVSKTTSCLLCSLHKPTKRNIGITQQPFYEHEPVKDSCFVLFCFFNIDSLIWMTKEFSIGVWKQWIFRQQCTRHSDVKAGKREGDNLSGPLRPPRNK